MSTAPSPTNPRLLWAGMFLLAMSVLLIEIALTRVFSVMTWYHFTYLIIALALMGFGAAGSHLSVSKRFGGRQLDPSLLARTARWFGLVSVGSVIVATRINLELQDVHTYRDYSQFFSLLLVYVAVGAPFLFGGLCIGYVISKAGDQINRLYFADLTGAGCGALLALLLINRWGAVETVFIAGTLAVLVGTVVHWTTGRRGRIGYALVLAAVSGLTLVQMGTGLIRVYFPPSKLGRLGMEGRFAEWHVVARVDVTPAKREFPSFGGALSSTWSGDFPDYRGVWQDGAAFTGLINLRGEPRDAAVLGHYLQGMPYVLKPAARALVIGVGGGIDLLIALHHGAKDVVGVDVNPVMIELLEERYLDYTGGLAARDDVELINAEGRHYLTLEEHEFDVIQLSGVDTFTALSTGAYALAENFLYTREAMQDLLDNLSDDGIVSFSRWLFDPPRETLRLVATQLEALRVRRCEHPEKHFFVVSGLPMGLQRPWADAMLKRSPFTEEEAERLRARADARKFVVEYDPYRPADNEFNRVLRSTPESWDRLRDDYLYDVSPATDDSPFFFQYYKWSRLFGFRAGRGGYGFMRFPMGLMVLIVTAAQILAMSFAVICWPLWKKGTPVRGVPGKVPVFIYFASLGLGFILIEMVLLQKLSIFVGGPVYSMGVTLRGILVFSGLGSRLGKRLVERNLKRRLIPLVGILAIVALAELCFVNLLVPRLMGLSHPVRCLVALATLLPLGMLMGVPFPVGVRIVERLGAPLIPWAWAINGCATVAGTMLAVVVSMSFGFSIALLAGIAVYVAGVIAVQFTPLPAPGSAAMPAPDGAV